MDELGYIKDLGKEVEKLGGHVIDVIPIVNVSNRLNPPLATLLNRQLPTLQL